MRIRNRLLAACVAATVGASGAAHATMESGATWLASRAAPNGAYEGAAGVAIPYQSTAEALSAFAALGIADPNLAAARQYLAVEAYGGTELLVRKVVAKAQAGEAFGPLLTDLQLRQNPDGGFGEAAGHDSSPLDSAFALEAFGAVGSSGPHIGSAIGYLLQAQKPDGGWGDAAGSNVYTSAVVLRSLSYFKSTYSIGQELQGGAAYLTSQRDGDTLWAEDFLSALGLIALATTVNDVAAIEESAQALGERQSADGSWAGDVYSTALALRALKLFAARKGGGTVGGETSTGSVDGYVFDGGTGGPLAAVNITPTAQPGLSVQTNGAGYFVISGLPAGHHTFEVSKAGYGSLGRVAEIVGGRVASLGTTLLHSADSPQQPPSTLTFYGQVVDGLTSAPVQGATVAMVGSASGATTDSLGKFVLEGIATLSFELDVSAAGYVAQRAMVAASAYGEASGTLPLSPTSSAPPGATQTTLQGVVTAADTSQSLADALVEIVGASGAVTTDAAGRYALSQLQALEFDVRISMPGFEPRVYEVRLSAHGTYTLDVALTRIATEEDVFQVIALDNLTGAIGANGLHEFTARIANLSQSEQSGLVLGEILDSSGVRVGGVVPYAPGTSIPQSEFQFQPEEVLVLTVPWSTAQLSPGTYTLLLRVVEPGSISQGLPSGIVKAERSAFATVAESREIAGSPNFDPPLVQAGSETPVQLRAMVLNYGNVDLPPQRLSLTIRRPSTEHVLHAVEADVGPIQVNDLAVADFGQWTPTEIGNLRITVASMTAGIGGTVQGVLYVGDRPAGTFTVDRTVVPTGTQTVGATIVAQGVDARLATTDPLYFAVHQAIKKGGEYVGPQAKNWHNSTRCLGCHIQTQSLFGLAASLRKGAEINLADAKFQYNVVSSSLQEDGGLRISHPMHTKVQTSLGLWALTQWPDRAHAFRTKYKAAQHMHARRAVIGDRVFWSTDHTTSDQWWKNNEAPTFLTMKGISDVLSEVDSPGWNGAVDYRADLVSAGGASSRPRDIEVGADGFLYVVKDGSINRIDAQTGGVEVAVSNLPTGCAGLAVDAGETYFITCFGTLYRVASGVLTKLYNQTRELGDVDLGPDGLLYFTDYGFGRVFRMSPGGGAPQAIAANAPLAGPYGLVIAPDASVFVTNLLGFNVVRIPPGGVATVYAEGLAYPPRWPALMPDGSLLITHDTYSRDGQTTNAGMLVVDTARLASRVMGQAGMTGAVVKEGLPYFANQNTDSIYRLTTMPMDLSGVGDLRAIVPGVARHILAMHQDGSADNIRQAQRLMTLGEARKHIHDAALLSQVDTAMGSIATLLQQRQLADGGWLWISSTTSASDALVTAFVGLALDYTNQGADDTLTRTIVRYLLGVQQPDKSWVSTNRVFTTKLGSTSLVMAYLPIALGRLGGLDTDIEVHVPATVALTAPSLQPTATVPNAGGGTDYRWHLEALTSSAPRTITFDLTLADLQLHEDRPVASAAFLASKNSFTNETVRVDLDIPVVRADDGLNVGVGTDRPVYGADDLVLINAPVQNAGSGAAAGRVVFRIADHAGVQVATLPDVAIEPIAAGGQIIATAEWLTGATRTGHYAVQALLYDHLDRLADEATAMFEIRNSTTDSPVASLRANTDRPVYHTTDRVLIGSLARNLTGNHAIAGAVLRLAVTGPNGGLVLAQDIALGELAPGSLTERNVPQALSSAPQGAYRVLGTLLDSAGSVLATATATYEVLENLALSITGTVTVAKPLILQGETQICTDTVQNRGTQDATGLPIRQTLARLDQDQLVDQSEVQLNVPAAGSDTLVRAFTTKPLAQGDYACALEAYVAGEWKALSNATFHVDPPPIRINAEFALGEKGRILILLDPPASNGDQTDPLGPPAAGAPLLNEQRTWLEDVLTREGWSYTIVLDATAFMREMRSGAYSVYALLTETVKLDQQFQREFREAIYRGEGLVEAGSHDQRNDVIDEALGIKYAGKHAQVSGVDLQASELSVGGRADYPVVDKTLRAILTGAQARGTVNVLGTSQPVLTSYSFGSGKSVYAGFDLLIHSTKTADASLFTDLLKKSPRYVEPPFDVLRAGRVVPVTLTLNNEGVATSGRVAFTLPAGSIIEDSGPAEIIGEHELAWAYTLAEAGKASITFWMRLPSEEGSALVHASIQVGEPGAYEEYSAVELALSVTQPAGLEQALAETASDLGLRLVNKYLTDAQRAIANSDYSAAIKALVQAADELAKSTHARASAIRRMVGQALYEVGMRL